MLRQWFMLGLVVIFTGAACSQTNRPPVTVAPTTVPVTLTVWRVFDQPEVFDSVIEKYQQLRPNVQIEVITKDYGDYELETANAIAAGIGPDIWIIRNDWLPKHVGKLMPMPDGLLASDVSGQAPAKKSSAPTTNLDIVKERYPAVVAAEAAIDGTVYGIPLSIDTLALYYNKDHFREAGLTHPPTTWSEFISDVEKLTHYDSADRTRIRRAGAAIGTAQNINRATDIVSLLMLQNHTPMTNETHTSALMNGAIPKQGGGLAYPGTNALEFYTGFADPAKSTYTWNNDLPNSIDAFASGQVSMMFSYAYLQRSLLQKNSTLNYGVAAMPQVDNTLTPVDYPTYWLEVVSRNSKHSPEAWDFLRFLSSEGDSLYSQAASKPPAKKSAVIPKLTERVLTSEPGSPWTFQVNTATTWFRGTNPGKVEQILGEMIENVTTFHQPPQVAIDQAAAHITKSLEEH